MRKLLLLAALLPITAAAIFLGTATTRPLFATTCTTNCSCATLTCTPVNYCTSTSTSLDCDGTVTTCAVADAWCACHYDCLDSCASACAIGPGPCNTCMRNC